MAKRDDKTCSDCYFRQEGLCALATETPCPTFRLAARGGLKPPRQAQLVPLAGALAAAGALGGREAAAGRPAVLA